MKRELHIIISGPGQRSTDNYYKLAKIVPHLVKDEDYTIDEKQKPLHLQILVLLKSKKCLVLKTLYDAEKYRVESFAWCILCVPML